MGSQRRPIVGMMAYRLRRRYTAGPVRVVALIRRIRAIARHSCHSVWLQRCWIQTILLMHRYKQLLNKVSRRLTGMAIDIRTSESEYTGEHLSEKNSLIHVDLPGVFLKASDSLPCLPC